MEHASATLIYGTDGILSAEEPHTLDPQWQAESIRGGKLSQKSLLDILARRSILQRNDRRKNDDVHVVPLLVRILITAADPDNVITAFRLAEHPQPVPKT